MNPRATIAALALCWPAFTAAAVIDWQVPWNVQLDQNNVTGAGDKRRAFGASATLDGQIVDLDADIAVARADAFVLAANSFAAGKVEFERPFRLDGAPQGWRVILQAVLSGSLFVVTDPGMLAETNLFGRARIVYNNGNATGLSADVTATRQAFGMTTFALDLFRDAAVLDDGIYTIKGSLEANALGGLPPDPQPPVVAQSLFFNGGWEVSILVRPAPEPPTALLVGLGLLAIVTLGSRTLRQRAAGI